MNTAGFLLTLICSGMVAFLPRLWAILGVFGAMCYITQGQQLDLGGLNFYAIRVVLLVAAARVVLKRELPIGQGTRIDKVLLLYALLTPTIYIFRAGFNQEQFGITYNILLSYFVFRSMVRSTGDLAILLPRLVIVILPSALFMWWESQTGNNIFDAMGGHVRQSEREGRWRCVGAFRGPHTAGTFGATLLPLFGSLFFLGYAGLALAGVAAATLITYASNSSGPLMAYLSSLIGLALWRYRTQMQLVRRSFLAGLILLAIVMKAPIWYVFAKISAIVGGDGWHRSYLMEQCMKHFWDWWLIGTDDTSGWAATIMRTGGADITNEFVSNAANGGLISLCLFILLLVRAFQGLGGALKAVRGVSREQEILLWCVGSVLFAHVVTFFSVTYFDQMHVAWWGLLGTISSITSPALVRQTVEDFEISDSDSPVIVPA